VASFGATSRRHRDTCEPALQRVLDEAIKHYDFSVIWGHRTQAAQDQAFRTGHSQLEWPNSKHNKTPSRAFDVIPYPGGFDSSDEEFYKLATYILSAASLLGVPIRWGGHWKNLKDMAHFELMD
jgi:peptidoglycan L-alanyl-D-glutamate endopeptidase CwlK